MLPACRRVRLRAANGSGPSGFLMGHRPRGSARADAYRSLVGPCRIVHSIGTVEAPGGLLVAGRHRAVTLGPSRCGSLSRQGKLGMEMGFLATRKMIGMTQTFPRSECPKTQVFLSSGVTMPHLHRQRVAHLVNISGKMTDGPS